MSGRATSALRLTRSRTCLLRVGARSRCRLRRSGRLVICQLVFYGGGGSDVFSLFGWKMGVSKRIFGGSSGYSGGKFSRARKKPPRNGQLCLASAFANSLPP